MYKGSDLFPFLYRPKILKAPPFREEPNYCDFRCGQSSPPRLNRPTSGPKRRVECNSKESHRLVTVVIIHCDGLRRLVKFVLVQKPSHFFWTNKSGRSHRRRRVKSENTCVHWRGRSGCCAIYRVVDDCPGSGIRDRDRRVGSRERSAIRRDRRR
jgi:hypothetical protein